MIYLLIFSAFILAASISLRIIPEIIHMAYDRKLFDIPNERKVHSVSVPRLGGLSFLPIIIITLLLTYLINNLYGNKMIEDALYEVHYEFSLFLGGLFLIYCLGIEDDLKEVIYKKKFVIQFVAASLFPLSGIWINNLHGFLGIYELSPFIGMPLTVLFTVFTINAINFIDGIDGLASGICGLSLFVFGILFIQYDQWSYSLLSFTTLGVLSIFFYYNVFGKIEKREKVFMGDTGSLTLGYIISFLFLHFILIGTEKVVYSLQIIVLAFSTILIPLLDTIRVMLVRIFKGKSIFLPDKNHIHHKFMEMGFTHRKVLNRILLLSFLYLLFNYILSLFFDITVILISDITIWVLFNFIFNYLMKREKILVTNSMEKIGLVRDYTKLSA